MIEASDILKVTTAVTKEWTKARKAEERGNRSRRSRGHIYSGRVNCTDVADRILPKAYAHASGSGRYSVSKRQMFYASRDEFKRLTNRDLEYGYFAGTLLVQYLNRHPETEAWKITADPRGTLIIPNAASEQRIPCGTLEIDEYLLRINRTVDEFDFDDYGVDVQWPSLAPGQRYQALLYVEKEGFWPLIEEAQIAERFDVAPVSCKGQSVVAVRKLVDHVCRVDGGVPLLVVHDCDKSGFEISQRLTKVSDWAEMNDRVVYRFENQIQVFDLGLRLSDAEKYQLAQESVEFRGDFASDSICTEEEKEFLRSGQRVELNAFTSPQFIEWLEVKLTERGLAKRLIPDVDILDAAYQRAVVAARLNAAIEEARDAAVEEASRTVVPKTIKRQVREAMKESPAAWDKVLYGLVKSKLYPDSDD